MGGEVSRDYTINISKRIHKVAFKKRAPRAIKEITKFAQANMLTDDVRIDTKLNQFIWSQGVRNIPRKVRVRMSRRQNEEEDSKTQLYTLVEHIPVTEYS